MRVTLRLKFISNYPSPTSTVGREKVESEADGGRSAVINDDSFQSAIKYWLIRGSSVSYICGNWDAGYILVVL